MFERYLLYELSIFFTNFPWFQNSSAVLSNTGIAPRYRSCWAFEMWSIKVRCAIRVKYTSEFKDLEQVKKSKIFIFLYGLHVENIFLYIVLNEIYG